jgi:ribosomal protein S18 acetylase RimI-like enzyme
MTEPQLATAERAEAAGALIAHAFLDDPVMSWVFAEPGARSKLEAFFGFLTVEAYVPLGATTLTAEACAVWTPPLPPEWPAERVERFRAVMGEACTPEDLARLQAMGEATEAVHPTESHWYLSVLAVHPHLRGHGFGGALLEHTLRRVDADGLPAYLESTNPRNVSLYERYGFEVVGAIELTDGPRLTAMWRPATRR